MRKTASSLALPLSGSEFLRPGRWICSEVFGRWNSPPMVLRVPGDDRAPQVNVVAHRIDLAGGRVHQLQLHDFLPVFDGFAQTSQRDLIVETDGGEGFPASPRQAVSRGRGTVEKRIAARSRAPTAISARRANNSTTTPDRPLPAGALVKLDLHGGQRPACVVATPWRGFGPRQAGYRRSPPRWRPHWL